MAGGRFKSPIPPDAPQKQPSAHAIVGAAVKRIDLRGKVSGAPSYVHDMRLPGLLHARVLRPPGYHARLVDFDRAAVTRLPGVVEVVQDGQFIAIIAEREELAQACAAAGARLRGLAQ